MCGLVVSLRMSAETAAGTSSINPLTLLHTALSEGLHTEDDHTCLELAQSIRTVLTELAERMSAVLKDQQELQTAVSKLLNRKVGQAAGGMIQIEKEKVILYLSQEQAQGPSGLLAR